MIIRNLLQVKGKVVDSIEHYSSHVAELEAEIEAERKHVLANPVSNSWFALFRYVIHPSSYLSDEAARDHKFSPFA